MGRTLSFIRSFSEIAIALRSRMQFAGQMTEHREAMGEAVDEQSTALSQSEFFFIVASEIKRCERSGSRFLVVVIDLESIRKMLAAERLHAVLAALKNATRDIDRIGWHQQDRKLGLLFPEIAQADIQGAVGAIGKKIDRTLRDNVAADLLPKIGVSPHILPARPENANSRTTSSFYFDGLAGATLARRLSKRSMDVVGGFVALAVLSPLLLVIAGLVKLTSPGPVVFRQKRIGLCGKAFTLFKFRSMCLDCDPALHREFVASLIAAEGIACHSGVYKMVDDPRVTRFGRFLRRSSLDELPQLVNVLRGDMSLIGPRPPLPYECEQYDCWHLRRVMRVKPGMTGLWQVHGRSKTNFDDMVRLDLRYVRKWSLWLDIKILLRTPAAVWSGDGAY